MVAEAGPTVILVVAEVGMRCGGGAPLNGEEEEEWQGIEMQEAAAGARPAAGGGDCDGVWTVVLLLPARRMWRRGGGRAQTRHCRCQGEEAPLRLLFPPLLSYLSKAKEGFSRKAKGTLSLCLLPEAEPPRVWRVLAAVSARTHDSLSPNALQLANAAAGLRCLEHGVVWSGALLVLPQTCVSSASGAEHLLLRKPEFLPLFSCFSFTRKIQSYY